MTEVPTLLRRLLTAPGPSGYEEQASAVWRSEAESFAEVTGDALGSSVARVAGRSDGPLLAVVGHIDEIGLIVTHIDDDGFLFFAGIGGWDPTILVGQRVEVLTADGPIPGVIGKKPIHLLKQPEREKAAKITDLHIDIAASDGDDAAERVQIGDSAVIAAEPVELPHGRITSRSLDNRLGAYVALEAARLVSAAGGSPGDIVAVAPVQEEITLGGAQTTAYSLRPDLAIVVDVTFATDPPGTDEKELGRHKLGSGPVIGRGATIHPRVYEALRDAAKAEEIEHTVAASARGTSTDADAIHLSRAGVPTGVLSIPLRYMHSPVEMVQLSDVQACARLIAAVAQRLDASASFSR
ncbi:MAG: M42 family metallopeptidase [Solirubrobacterales bacterium]